MSEKITPAIAEKYLDQDPPLTYPELETLYWKIINSDSPYLGNGCALAMRTLDRMNDLAVLEYRQATGLF